MKASELKTKDVAELSQELDGLLKEQFNLRMQKGSGQMAGTHQLRQVRRDIARVKTVLTQKTNEGGKS